MTTRDNTTIDLARADATGLYFSEMLALLLARSAKAKGRRVEAAAYVKLSRKLRRQAEAVQGAR